MGVNYSANIVVGIKLGDLGYKDAIITEEVTRYNEKTGEPYRTTVKKDVCTIGRRTFVGTKTLDILKSLTSGDIGWVEDTVDEESLKVIEGLVKFLAVCTTNYLSDIRPENLGNECILGSYCCGVNDWNSCIEEINKDQVNKVTNDVAVLLKNIFGYEGEIKTYIQMNVSY